MKLTKSPKSTPKLYAFQAFFQSKIRPTRPHFLQTIKPDSSFFPSSRRRPHHAAFAGGAHSSGRPGSRRCRFSRDHSRTSPSGRWSTAFPQGLAARMTRYSSKMATFFACPRFSENLLNSSSCFTISSRKRTWMGSFASASSSPLTQRLITSARFFSRGADDQPSALPFPADAAACRRLSNILSCPTFRE